jgi:hypothetical protein
MARPDQRGYSEPQVGVRWLILACVAILASPPPADAAGWLPHDDGAEWTYEWTDSVYNPTPTREKLTVKEQNGNAFLLEWTTQNLGNPPGAPSSVGLIAFQDTASGVVNTNWQSSAPPPNFPILCASAVGCGNSLASTPYLLIWGSRAPVLAEPVLAAAAWSSRGGAEGDVASTSRYLGRENVTVPAFPGPVTAVKVRSDITQAGALGDPYGSGVRTVWWVYGVGPVKIVFDHAGGASASVTTSVLQSTDRTAAMPPPDTNYFPLRQGARLRYRWKNSKHLRRPSVQEAVVAEVANQSARFDFKHVSGPLRLVATYGFALRTDGLTNIFDASKAVSQVKFPRLGPRARRRHFYTPFDLMIFGLSPILEAYPAQGQRWSAKSPSRDFSVYGVTGTTRVLGFRRVTVPAGRFNALAVQSRLRQRGYPFGSGTRTSYFAAGRGLVKLVFRHGDRSTSTVELVK